MKLKKKNKNYLEYLHEETILAFHLLKEDKNQIMD